MTFSHNANFFLFTTLENARPIAKGRGPVASPSIPVLTGSPVAGMAYLDRPTPAGYFIFPDLSVRHEGLYRLSFSLFEELKESTDADVEPPEGSPKTRDKLLSSNPMAPQAHVHFRLEVKSIPFAVYSAKKFPGLSESTTLSRTVAEQGCRVRIRRDVRMRRRDKPNDGYQDEYHDDHYARSDRYTTPQQAPDRPRSISNGSIDTHTPYSNGRRPSLQDYFQQQPINYPPANYPQPPPPAPLSSTSSYGGGHLSFGGSATTPTFPPPQMPAQPVQSYVQSSNSFQYPSGAHSRQMSAPQTYGYQQLPQQPVSTYAQPVNYAQPAQYNDSPDYQPILDHRRASASVITYQTRPTSIPQAMNNYVQNHPALQQSYFNSQQQSPSHPTTPIDSNGQVPPQLPPLRTDNIPKHGAMEPRYELKSPSNSIPRPIMPSPSYTGGYCEPYGPAIQSGNSMPDNMVHPTVPRTGKRDFGTVFDNSHMNQPIHNGMRPSSADQGRERQMIETDLGVASDSYEDLGRHLVYKRADGSQTAKSCPSPTR